MGLLFPLMLYWQLSASRGLPMSTPGRSRTDTGDPFRGPASSLGLRGRGNDTSAGPNNSRVLNGGERFPEVHIFNSAIIIEYAE